MAYSALSALVVLASLTLVAGQTTPAPAATTSGALPTFPATPLVSMHFRYDEIVGIFCSQFQRISY